MLKKAQIFFNVLTAISLFFPTKNLFYTLKREVFRY
jgi:hypothetical protein